MIAISIAGRIRKSRIVSSGGLERLATLAKGRRSVIVTDAIVNRLHGRRFPRWPVIEIGSGEQHKTLATVAAICRRLHGIGADRSTLLVGIGGGVVCDAAGFAASIYMRGLRFALVPTTLLAQVDAAIGGKNGVNLDSYKNLLGVFNQPEFVLRDPRLLGTLPRKEILCGIAEIIKAAAIADRGLFDLLETGLERLLELEPRILATAIRRAVQVKVAIVDRDETEKMERRKLNFGHTLAHALEKALAISHGEAVAIGMAAAAGLSRRKGLLDGGECARIVNLITRSGLPVTVPAVAKQELLRAMEKDKKKEGDRLHLILLKKLGQAVIVPTLLTDLAELLP